MRLVGRVGQVGWGENCELGTSYKLAPAGEMLKFALENDGINSISFKISDITKLHELRHSYLHLSDSPDDNFVNQANYEKEDGSFKKRDVLKG